MNCRGSHLRPDEPEVGGEARLLAAAAAGPPGVMAMAIDDEL